MKWIFMIVLMLLISINWSLFFRRSSFGSFMGWIDSPWIGFGLEDGTCLVATAISFVAMLAVVVAIALV